MKIYLATDHAGFKLKEKVKKRLSESGNEIEDCGAFEYVSSDDYPDFIKKAAEGVSNTPGAKAIIFGGSGQGEAIVANKFKGVRAVVFYSPVIPAHAVDIGGRTSSDAFEMIRLTREHNDSNVLSLGANILNEEDAFKAIDLWLAAKFSNDERHQRRIDKIAQLENE